MRRLFGPCCLPVMVDPLSGAPVPPRLWMKIPSKVCVSGCSASAIGRQIESRLRFTHRQDVLGMEGAQDAVLGVVQGLTNLGVDVEGVLIARLVERPVASRFGPDQAAARGGVGAAARGSEDRRTTVHAEMLDRHRHVGIAGPHQFRVEVVPIRRRLAGRDVHPLDHHVAVEMSRILRPPDQDPGPVGGRGAGHDAPPPIAWFGLGRERSGLPRREKLLLDVAVGGQLQGIRTERFNDASGGDRAGKGGGGLVSRARGGGSRRRCAEGPAPYA